MMFTVSRSCALFGTLVNVKSFHNILKTMSSSTVKAVLIDLSGTLHIEDTPIHGSQDALKRLRGTGVKMKFVTNTTKEPLQSLFDRLVALGFEINKDEIFTSLTAARKLVEEKNLRPLLYLEETAKQDFHGISTENPNSVVIGLAPETFNYTPMNNAFRMLLDGAPLIAIHKARYFKKKDGLYLGPGPFVTALEYATDCKAHVVGKPEESFFLKAIEEFDSGPNCTVMIGDDVRDDVGGAMKSGMLGILVQTGKYRPGDEDKINPQPTNTSKDFPEAVDFIINNLI